MGGQAETATYDPLVMALGWHMVGCSVCRAAGRAVCPAGRSLSDVAYAAMQARRAA